MKVLIAVSVVFLALLTFTPPATGGKGPYVCKDTPTANTCLPDDPLGPCPGRFITVCNPLKKKVWVHIGCGRDVMTNVYGPVTRKASQTFQIEVKVLPGGLSEKQCYIDRWSYKEDDVKNML